MPTLSTLSQRLDQTSGQLGYRALTWAVARAVGVREQLFSIAGVQVPVLVREGVGVPALLVHGFGADKEGWLPMAALLRRDRPLVIPDLPGFGAAGAIGPEAASARAQAAALVGLLDRLGIERAHLVGSSMGGGISLRLAADAASRVASMTLIGSVGPVVEKSDLFLALDRGENLLLTKDAEDFDRMLSLVAHRMPPTPRPIRRYLGACHSARRASFEALFQGWIASAATEGVPEDLGQIEAPALVLHGEHDRVIHPSTAVALREGLPNAHLEMLPGIGHIPQMEAPLQVARSIDGFWSRR